MSDKAIKCENCGMKIAEGQTPSKIKIKCTRCNHVNDLELRTESYTERVMKRIEKK